MSDLTESRQLLAGFRDQPSPAESPEARAARRAQVVTALERQLAAPLYQPRRRWLPLLAAAVVVSGSALATVVLTSTPPTRAPSAVVTEQPGVEVGVVRGHAVHVAAHASVVLTAGEHRRVASDGTLSTLPDAQATIRVGQHIAIEVAPETQLPVPRPAAGADDTHQIQLTRGELRLVVDRTTPRQRVAVQTPDARVLVRGTTFRVGVKPEARAGQRTCVTVEEGQVVVQHAHASVELGPGQSWGCAPPPVTARAEPERAPRPTASQAVSTLALETRLLRDAIAAERAGQLDDAERILATLLAKYPASPLAPDARMALARVRSAR